MKYKIIFSLLLLSVLIYIIANAIKIEDLTKIIFDFPKEQLILFFALSMSITILKAWRFLILLRNTNINLSFWENTKAFIASQAITPLPGGEAMRSILVKHESGASIAKTAGPVLTQAVLEMFTASLIFLIGSFFYKFLRVPAFILLCLILVIIAVLIYPTVLKFIYKILPDFKFIEKIYQKILIAQKNIRTNVFDNTIIKAFSLSVFTNIIGGLLIYLIASSYEVKLDLFRCIFIYSSSTIIQGLTTISPGGLGFTEGGMTGILLLSNVDLGKSIAIVLLYRFTTLFFTVVLGLVFLLLFYGKSFILNNLSKGKHDHKT